MIFNPRRGGGEKEYTIKAKNTGIALSVTKQKPGHTFQATSSVQRSPKMEFKDPDTGESVTIQGLSRRSDFVMPAADVTITN